MLKTSDLVQIIADSYDYQVRWDHLWNGSNDADIWFGIKIVGDETVGVFRGSRTQEDWYRDLLALPTVKHHPQLGPVHEGFDEGLDELFKQAVPYLGNSPIICGHSLGGARSWLFAGRLIVEGIIPKGIIVCGSPRPGCEQLRSIVGGITGVSFKNRFDPVTLVPIWLPTFPAVQMKDFTMLDEVPMEYDILADHHIQYYVKGAKRLDG